MDTNCDHHRRHQLLAAAAFLLCSGLMAAVWCSTWLDSFALLNASHWPLGDQPSAIVNR